MFPSRRCGGAEGLLFLCMSSTMVHGLIINPTSSTLPGTGNPTASTSSLSMATPTPSVPSVSVAMEKTPQTALVPTETPRPSNAFTPSVSMTTTPASITSVSMEELLRLSSVSTEKPVTTTSGTMATTLVSTSNTPTTVALPPPNAEQFKAVHQTENNITLQWSMPANYTLNSFNFTLQFDEETINITGGPAGTMNYTREGLEPARWYNFTLYTNEHGISSSGVSIRALTAPPNAEQFKAVHQTENNITLQWSMPANYTLNSFNFILQFDEETINITGGPAGTMNYTREGLEPARWYSFTLYTNEHGISSSGVSIRALTAPVRVERVFVDNQNSSSIRLRWEEVKNITTYLVEYRDSGGNNITSRVEVPAVTYTASALRSATSYTFTVYSRLENISSSGYSISAVTAPLAVTMVIVKRLLSEVVLSWSRDGNSSYLLIFGDQTISPVPTEPRSAQVSHRVSSLQEGTRYNYSIIASYQEVNSTTYQNYTVTTINCSAVGWRVTNSTIQASSVGVFTDVSATNGSESHSARPDHTDSIWLTGLYPGATYKLSVNYRTFLQCQHSLTLSPPDIRAHCEYGATDTILLRWEPPAGVWTGVEVNVTGRTPVVTDKGGELHAVLNGFQPAKTYQVSTCLFSGHLRSTVQILDCRTDARGVIAGSVASVLIVLLLVAMVVYFCQRRRSTPRQRTDFVGWSAPSDTYKSIPADLFEDHVRQMSRDENWGFSEEYENFIPVGTEQTCKAAIIPENKAKNRFTNVLPYDWSRVKLSMQIEVDNSDYINASYLPGYGGSKEYIAAQGPLAGTLADFWRMVWEQGVRAIAMVTNCIEGDRNKCEQYWPLDYTPCLYGDLLVTSTSEQTQPSWTIRSFTVKNRATSEERSVQHFHFRAWPDHGVPDGTLPLLQFRALLRQHMEQEGDGSPTLVHCSAGVGRTGTLVALDVLLQQMEAEGVVDVAAFVHKMRLSRPLMVQTESQYVFLHHCLLEAMHGSEAEQEHTYQNLIYTNATALQQLPFGVTSI